MRIVENSQRVALVLDDGSKTGQVDAIVLLTRLWPGRGRYGFQLHRWCGWNSGFTWCRAASTGDSAIADVDRAGIARSEALHRSSLQALVWHATVVSH